MIAQKLLGQDLAVAAVAIDAAQIKGVLRLPLSVAEGHLPGVQEPANAHLAVSLTPEQFRYAFGNAITDDESDQLFDRWAIPPRASRCSRPPRPASTRTPRPRWTPRTHCAARCC